MVGRKQQSDLVTANVGALRSLTRAISLANGEFSLVLVCCNYQVLQEQILQQLQQILGEKCLLQEVFVPPQVRSLYSTIHSNIAEKNLNRTENRPKVALMILGLESVNEIDDLLSSINQVRDEFRKKHPFPMVLWVNEELLRKLRRLAPDFASWAATPIKFGMTTVQLQQFLQQETDSLFTTVLNIAFSREQEPQIIKENQCSNKYCLIKKSQELGNNYKESSENYCQCTLEQIWLHKNELHYAIKDLQTRGINLTPELEASLEFVFGLDEYVKDRIEKAIKHFRNSYQLTVNSYQLTVNSEQFSVNSEQRTVNRKTVNNENTISSPSPPLPFSPSPCHPSPSPHLLHQGVILFYLGLCFYRLAERNHGEQYGNWQFAVGYFQKCLEVFELAERPMLVAQFIGQLSEVLQQLEDWNQLRVVAHKSLELHQQYGSYTQLACDCGYLADVALHELQWKQASKYAQASLFYLAEAKTNHKAHHALFPLLLEQVYQLVLVKSLQFLGEEKAAKLHLENASKNLSIALENSDYRYDVHRYIRLLRRLRWLYYESGKYLEAFFIRRERRSVQQQYGLRAFIGAGRLQPQRKAKNPVLVSPTKNSHVALEITASGRERDINLLIGKISRSDKKLTLIHGESGVGKSSIVNAGLVPALQNRPIGDQIAVPVVLQVYTDWIRELGKSLSEAMFIDDTAIQYTYGKELNNYTYAATPITIASISEKLRENANNHLITVLIFDQLEEFFFVNTDRSQKEDFDDFICECLNIPFVKIIFSLREDYLHHLLDLKRLARQDSISNNILDKDIRYQVNNLSAGDAKSLIQKLTERSEYNIEPALIDSLVEDLSSEIGEVRPIELQVVGAQLQDENITTLAKYEPYRPNKLIERYIKEIIKDCGSENEQATLLVLYLLTDENHKRPFKTKAELTTDLAEFESAEKLELVLEILVRSGLVVLFADITERYQLIHDYLVDLIRSFQQEELIQTQLTQLRNQVQQRETEITRLHSELRKKKEAKIFDNQPSQHLDLFTELKELRKRDELSRRSIEQLSAELEQQKLQAQLAESQQQQKLSEVKVNRSLKIALAGSVTAILALTASTIMSVYLWRQALISEIQAISASAEELASSGKDFDALRQGLKAADKFKTAFLPDAYTKAQVMTALHQVVPQIREKETISGHLSGVNSVAFSPLNSLVASASADNTVKLWYPNGKFFRTLSGHTDVVNSVNFSPDGRTVASASQDKTVKLWTLDGRASLTLSGHENIVNSVAFSPNGKIIASGSTDKTIKLWNRKGELIKTLFGHDDAVLEVAFSPINVVTPKGFGQILASVGSDRTIKLWDNNGKNIRTISGHRDAITSIGWSNDGKVIASASLDNTVKLWNRQGKLLKVIKAHSEAVTAVKFSPDNQIISTVSTDGTVKLWRWKDGILLGTLKGHKDWVNDVNFSPDNQTLASASRDKTVKLWSWQDLLLGNLKTHNKAVTSVSFSTNSNLIASASVDKTIQLWTRDGKQIKTLQPFQEEIWDVSFSPDGENIASAGKDKTIKLWRKNGEVIKTIAAHNNVILSLDWSSKGNIFASASKDKTVKLWRRNGELIITLKGHQQAVNWVSFNRNGNLIASASDDNTVKIWDKSGKLLHTLTGHKRPVFALSWSNKDNILASASLDGTVKLWNKKGELQQTLIVEGEEFTGVTFSPDGKLLAATSEDKVKLWQRDGTLLITLKADGDEFTTINFSPDGKTLLSGTNRGTIIVRDLDDLTLEKLKIKGCDALRDYEQLDDKLCVDRD
ncbi:WD-40 repeat-containing protein [Calothrix parasitica NIES-267]|uniref:WD-40 repeat-containing protein n=1 Tax=Calothrix parasitica NIES-267 TaxID=1973488 RepID=A0A1Z4LYN6_9CYAN|nr:WD-40 repeat-containing protein [Calothrix parasitica NIES-267]